MLWRRFCKFLTVFSFIVCLLFIVGFAFDRLLTTQPNHPASQFIKAKFKQPEEWRPFTSQKGKFRVLIPGGYAATSERLMKINGQILTVRSFQVLRKNPISFTVSYLDFPVQPSNAAAIIQARIDDGLKTMNGKKLSSQNTNLNQIPGKEVYLAASLGNNKLPVVIRHRVSLKGQRLYQIIVVTPSQDQFREESDRFMESFEIIN